MMRVSGGVPVRELVLLNVGGCGTALQADSIHVHLGCECVAVHLFRMQQSMREQGVERYDHVGAARDMSHQRTPPNQFKGQPRPVKYWM